ncbi:hypothetical protein ACF07V_13190 [Streptomyces sp. NPDC015661]|uniref:hypothetical protein n=1 Tax=Streptomyces sp. NPDC015661 TaxID=3364961 RepID=UPI003701CDB9
MRATLVLATALVAGIAPVALGGAAAVAAPAPVAAAPAASTAELGTVVQVGPRLALPAGGEGPETLRFKATLPAGVTGPVKARVTLPITNWPGGGWTDYRTAARIVSTCSVGGGAFTPCAWNGTRFEEEDKPARVVLDLPAVEASATLEFAVTMDLPAELAWIGSLDAPVELKDASGSVVSQGKVGIDVFEGVPNAYDRGAVHARDKDGVLWRYEGTGNVRRVLAPRTKVGGGWNIYTSILPVTTTRASGDGDLVARDKAGVLWYYKGTGNPAAPFAPRVKVGAGWNIYTAFSAHDGGLLARDRDGVLWNYDRNASSSTAPFKPRVKVGAGWNGYNTITSFGSGLLARDKAGVLWSYASAAPGTSAGARPLKPRVKVGGGWNIYSAVVGTGDLHRGGVPDVLARDTSGRLWEYSGVVTSAPMPSSTRSLIGAGWNIYDTIF